MPAFGINIKINELLRKFLIDGGFGIELPD